MSVAAVQTARKNARNTVINSFFLNGSSFLLPIWQLFYTQQLGMTLTQSMVLSASSWIVTAVANVPTGVLADKYGRIKLFRLGLVLSVITYIPMFFTKDYALLFGFSLISGIAGAVIDGSLEANVMDSYDAAGLTQEESSHFGSNQMVATYISRVLSGIVGAWLYTIWTYGPLLANVLLLVVVLLQSYTIREVRWEKASELAHFAFLKKVFRDTRQSRVVMLSMAFTLLVSVGCESLWSAFQQYLLYRNVPEEAFGIMFGIIAVTSAFSAWMYRHTSKRWDWRWLSWFTILLGLTGSVLTHVAAPYTPVVVAFVIGLGFGTIYPVAYDVTQRNVKSQYRVTVSSVRQFIYLGGFAVATIMVGLYVDMLGREAMLNILTIQFIIVATIGLGLILLDNRRRDGAIQQ